MWWVKGRLVLPVGCRWRASSVSRGWRDEAVVEVPYRTDRKILADLKALKLVPYAAEIENKRIQAEIEAKRQHAA